MTVTKNPEREELAKMASANGSVRALRDPATGDIFAWPAGDAFHVDMAGRLNLPFKTRDEVQRNSFLFSREQLDQHPDALDLNGLVLAFAR